MAERRPFSVYTAAQGRRFALTVGAAFLVIAGVLWWRQSREAYLLLGAIGSLLAFAGLTVPQKLRPVERAWMAVAHAISKVTTPIVMGAMYLLVLLPVGVLRRALGGNPLVHVVREGSYWQHRPETARRSSMRRQF
jgi:Saxitoxin biosynthesis operon protein SxtJ